MAARHDGGQTPGLWTAANVVTVVRLFGILLWVLSAELVGAPGAVAFSLPHLLVGLFFVVIAGTDSLDGYLARSRNEVTNFGKFLDPIADKLVVVCALLVLMQWGLVSIWVIVVIVAREFIVSALRMVVASHGVVVAASNLGKWKTATTMGAIAGYFLYCSFPATGFGGALSLLSGILMAAAVVLTIWSGVDYVVKGWKYVS